MWEVAVVLGYGIVIWTFAFLAVNLSDREHRYLKSFFFLLCFALFPLLLQSAVLMVDTSLSSGNDVVTLLNVAYYVSVFLTFIVLSYYFVFYLVELFGYLKLRYGRKD